LHFIEYINGHIICAVIRSITPTSFSISSYS